MRLFTICCLIILAVFISGCDQAVVSGYDFHGLNLSGDPVQEPPDVGKAQWQIPGGQFIITPVARYQVAALVESVKRYSNGWQGQLAPMDILLAWGRMTDPEVQKYCSFSQSNRWGFYQYKAGCPVDGYYISSHCSNHHLIPATANIRAALKQIRNHTRVKFEGYLVNVDGKWNGRDYWWHSSTSRTDTGDGACELLLVQKVQIDNKIYR